MACGKQRVTMESRSFIIKMYKTVNEVRWHDQASLSLLPFLETSSCWFPLIDIKYVKVRIFSRSRHSLFSFMCINSSVANKIQIRLIKIFGLCVTFYFIIFSKFLIGNKSVSLYIELKSVVSKYSSIILISRADMHFIQTNLTRNMLIDSWKWYTFTLYKYCNIYKYEGGMEVWSL